MTTSQSASTLRMPTSRRVSIGVAAATLSLACSAGSSHAQLGKFLEKTKKAVEKVAPGATPESESASPESDTPERPDGRDEMNTDAAGSASELVIDLTLPDWQQAPEMVGVSNPEGQLQVGAKSLGDLMFIVMQNHAEADYEWQIRQLESLLSRFSRKGALTPPSQSWRNDDGQVGDSTGVDEKIPPRELSFPVNDAVAKAALEYIMNQGARRVEMLSRAISKGIAPTDISVTGSMRSDDMLRDAAPALGAIEGFSDATTYIDFGGQRAALTGALSIDQASGKSGAAIVANSGLGINDLRTLRPDLPYFEVPDGRRVRIYGAARTEDHTPMIALVVDGQLLAYRDDRTDTSRSAAMFDLLKRSGSKALASTTTTLLADGQLGASTVATMADGDDLCRIKVMGLASDSAVPTFRHKVGAWTITPISAGAPHPKFDMMLEVLNKQIASAMGSGLGLLYMVAKADTENPGLIPPVLVSGPDGTPLMPAPHSFDMITSLARAFDLDPNGRDNALLTNAIIEKAVEGRLLDPLDPQSQQRAVLAAQLSEKNSVGVTIIFSGWDPQWEYVTVNVGGTSFDVPAKPLTEFRATTVANRTLDTTDLASIYDLGSDPGAVSRLDVARYSGNLWSKVEEFKLTGRD